MPKIMKKGLFDSTRIVYIQLCDISIPPSKIRKKRTSQDDELMRSVLRYGVIQPVSVRRLATGFELVSGSRRYFAARLAGLDSIPCVILNIDTPEGELIALTENLQRRNLDFVEEAEELYRLINLHSFSQNEASRRIGISQSAIANKLRLLTLPKDVLYSARDLGLTERHLRELLRLKELPQIKEGILKIAHNSMTVNETAKYVDGILNPHREPKIAIGSTVMFINTVNRAAELMRKSGFKVELLNTEDEDSTQLKIVLSKKPEL